jgi:spore coat polysaccharide biosynthesis protein SpsF
VRPRVVASIEARMGSTRLPGKVLKPIVRVPALRWMIERLKRATCLHGIVIATTESPLDDDIETFAREHGVAVFRGSESDVLDRVVRAHRQQGSDIVIELCGDCPLIDPEIVDLAVDTFLANVHDVVTNARKPSYPQGLDVQVYRRDSLEAVATSVRDRAVREHVSLHFYDHERGARHRDGYAVHHLIAPRHHQAPDVRLQLDYEDDLTFLNKLCAPLFEKDGYAFGVEAILDELTKRPELRAINGHRRERRPR